MRFLENEKKVPTDFIRHNNVRALRGCARSSETGETDSADYTISLLRSDCVFVDRKPVVNDFTRKTIPDQWFRNYKNWQKTQFEFTGFRIWRVSSLLYNWFRVPSVNRIVAFEESKSLENRSRKKIHFISSGPAEVDFLDEHVVSTGCRQQLSLYVCDVGHEAKYAVASLPPIRIAVDTLTFWNFLFYFYQPL